MIKRTALRMSYWSDEACWTAGSWMVTWDRSVCLNQRPQLLRMLGLYCVCSYSGRDRITVRWVTTVTQRQTDSSDTPNHPILPTALAWEVMHSALTYVRASVRPFVSTLYIPGTDRLTIDLELLHMSRSQLARD